MFDAPWHWIVLAIVVIAMFGYKRLPDASRAVGRSLRIFKSELKGLSEDDSKAERSPSTPELPPASQQPAVHPNAVSPQVTPRPTGPWSTEKPTAT